MKLIYRGQQERIISTLATKLGYSPTELMFKLAKDLNETINKHPIDALAAQENNNAREEDKG